MEQLLHVTFQRPCHLTPLDVFGKVIGYGNDLFDIAVALPLIHFILWKQFIPSENVCHTFESDGWNRIGNSGWWFSNVVLENHLSQHSPKSG